LFYLYNFTAFVVTALRADTVWHSRLTTVWTKVGLWDSQRIVCTTFVPTSFWVSSLWIWH